ncbi:MAG: Uma2 family endonuclease [Bacteroidota bacterium]
MALAENIHHLYTAEQYVALEQESDLRYEFYQGEVFAMAGGTMQHNLIIQNIATALRSLRSRGCHVFAENVKLEVVADEFYVYPDVMLTCQPQDIADNRLARYPCLVIEVLSESTEAYDRGKKLDRYLRMPSLQAYVIISQKEFFVGCYERKGDFWSYRILDQPEDLLRLESLDWEMTLTQVYEDIVFPKED